MIKIIPAIDIISGHCVRLSQGDYNKKTEYNKSPASVAKLFEVNGFKRLHVVDLDGAREGKVTNIETLKNITGSTTLSVDFGGGIKSNEDLDRVIRAGANAVSIGSIAVKNPDMVFTWIEKYGPHYFILSADVQNNIIRTNGWTKSSNLSIKEFLSIYWDKGIRKVLCTDISKDGMLCGSNIDLYKNIMNDFPDCELIASGGISSIKDIKKLDEAKIPAVVIGKAIYEGHIPIKDLAELQ